MPQMSPGGAGLWIAPPPPGSTRLGLMVPISTGIAIPLTAFGKVLLVFSLVPAVGIFNYKFGGKNRRQQLAGTIRSPLAPVVGVVFTLWAISAAGSAVLPSMGPFTDLCLVKVDPGHKSNKYTGADRRIIPCPQILRGLQCKRHAQLA